MAAVLGVYENARQPRREMRMRVEITLDQTRQANYVSAQDRHKPGRDAPAASTRLEATCTVRNR